MRERAALQVVLLWAGLLLLAGGVALSHSEPVRVDTLSSLALALAVLIFAAKIGGEAAGRIGQPAVLGELAAGVLLGNLGLGGMQRLGGDPYLDVLARLGMLLLLFEVGLQLSVRDLFAVGPSSLGVALCGTVSSFLIGWAVAASLLDTVTAVHVFLGAAITATSVGITARVLKDLGASRSSEAKIILGAAIVDDVLALVILALVTGWLGARQAGEAFQGMPAVALVAKTLGFLTLAILLGVRLTPGWFRYAAKLRTPGALLAVGLCFCFFLSWAASAIGLAALVGAFAAGLILEDVHSEAFVKRGERSLSELIEPMTSFLVPVFFVLVGFRTSIRALAHLSWLEFSLGLVVAAVLGKLACAFGVRVPGARKMTVAIAMIPRGEVTLIFAALGSSLRLGSSALLDDATYTALVAVVLVTTLVTPVALKWSVRSSAGLPRRVSWTGTSGG
jgi:Kef-type K+ transport system membrane component KefB